MRAGSFIIILAILIGSIHGAYAFSGSGSGTYSNPYQISDVDELQEMEDDLAAYYELVNDIDASATSGWNGGLGFDPIGNVINPFTGGFDGNGYSISDIYIARLTEDYNGLFGYAWAASSDTVYIHNFTLINPDITGKRRNGAIGVAEGSPNAYNIHVNKVGVVGGSIYDYTSGYYTSGLVGVANDAEISDCFSTTEVNGDFYVAGIVSAGSRTTINRVYFAGTIVGQSKANILYYVADPCTVTYTYYNSNLSSIASNGYGTAKTTSQMLRESTYSTFDFDDVWTMQPTFNSGYPSFETIVDTEPYIYYPANGTAINTNYPPMQHDIMFQWYPNSGVTSSSYTLARDSGYTNTVASGTITGSTKTLGLDADTYYFRVKYNFVNGTSSAYNETIFDITTSYTDYGTGIQGTVFETIQGSQTPVQDAKVVLYNDTHSYDYITASDGYYLFNSISNGTYAMIVSKNGYTTSTINLVTLETGVTTLKNIVLAEEIAPTYIEPHYVRFILTNLITKYSDIPVSVYQADGAVPILSGITGTDGAVSFKLDENIEYTLIFEEESQGIYVEYTVTPSDTTYYVLTFTNSFIPEDRDYDNIIFGCYGSRINMTTGYIYLIYNDTSGTTTNAEMWINDTDGVNLYYFDSTNSTESFNQTVDATNETYVVGFKLTNAVLDDSFAVQRIINMYNGVRIPLGFADSWNYILIAVMLCAGIGMLFTYQNVYVGGVVTVLTGWFMFAVTGWLKAGMADSGVLTMAIMLLLGTLLAFGAAIVGDGR